jgi:anti-sigma28 factor (negative regulator of flagellin synthesis)
MNSVSNISGSAPIQKLVNQPVRKETPVDAPKQLPVTDRLELSNMSQLLEKLKANDIRTDKVAEIKSQIESGTYENDQKLTVAADRVLDELFK